MTSTHTEDMTGVVAQIHLFPNHPIAVGLRKGHYIRKHVYEFVRCVAPQLDLGVMGCA
jgi:hypothetical protein